MNFKLCALIDYVVFLPSHHKLSPKVIIPQNYPPSHVSPFKF